MSSRALDKGKSRISFKPCSKDIEDTPSVCSDSIPFVAARSAINEAFCKSSCGSRPPTCRPPVCNEWRFRTVGSQTISVNHSRYDQKVEFPDPRDIVGFRQTISSTSCDEINHELFMFSSRCPRPCFCWKRSIFGCSYCASKFCWTWPALRSQPYYGHSLSAVKLRTDAFHPYYGPVADQAIVDSPSRSWYKEEERCSPKLYSNTNWSRRGRNYKYNGNRLVMEEAERKEETERWRERSERGAASEVSTLPVKRPWVQPSRITTRVTLEGARHISSNDAPSLNGILSGRGEGEQRHRGEQTDPDDKPPKLVVNLNQSDKASQIPEPLPSPEPEIESKKIDEVDGTPEQENSCLVDCLYVTLQCCDCSIM